MKRTNYRFEEGNGLQEELEHSLVFRLRKEIDFLQECQVKAEIKYSYVLQDCDLLQIKLRQAEKEIVRLKNQQNNAS